MVYVMVIAVCVCVCVYIIHTHTHTHTMREQVNERGWEQELEAMNRLTKLMQVLLMCC